MKKWIVFFCLLWMFQLCYAEESAMKLRKAPIDLHNTASLQRGAKYYVNYCAACHSLKYVRYNRMARDIGLVDEDDVVYENLLKNNLIFTESKVGDVMVNALS